MLCFLWRASRGYRLRPWRSPYLRWRIETYWGLPAEKIGFGEFWMFLWMHRTDLLRFLSWASRTGRAPSGARTRTRMESKQFENVSNCNTRRRDS